MINSEEFLHRLNLAHHGPVAGNEILVCTHGSRDCRCGDIGGDLVQSLRETARKRGIDVKVTECSHVGGHKWVSYRKSSFDSLADPGNVIV